MSAAAVYVRCPGCGHDSELTQNTGVIWHARVCHGTGCHQPDLLVTLIDGRLRSAYFRGGTFW